MDCREVPQNATIAGFMDMNVIEIKKKEFVVIEVRYVTTTWRDFKCCFAVTVGGKKMKKKALDCITCIALSRGCNQPLHQLHRSQHGRRDPSKFGSHFIGAQSQ